MTKRVIVCCVVLGALVSMPGTSQARWMNVSTGRFQTMDTYEGDQEDPQSLHRYTYVHNDPVDNIDPTGRAVYFVTRRFDSPGVGTWFTYQLARIGHGYLLFTPPGDPGNEGDPLKHGWAPLTTFSWHPQSWDYANASGAYDFQTRTPGRIWERHPSDVNPSNYNIYRITADQGVQSSLLKAIYGWVNSEPVGYDYGAPRPDPSNPGGNEIGIPQYHRPAPSNGIYYSLMEQNCVWWVAAMLVQNNVTLPDDVRNAILGFNKGGGAAGQVISGERGANVMHDMSYVPVHIGLGGGYEGLESTFGGQ